MHMELSICLCVSCDDRCALFRVLPGLESGMEAGFAHPSQLILSPTLAPVDYLEYKLKVLSSHVSAASIQLNVNRVIKKNHPPSDSLRLGSTCTGNGKMYRTGNEEVFPACTS